MKELKERLYVKCTKWIEGQITSVEEAILAAQTSANEETKSSAGDKYETGRAMAQLEIEKLSTQLAEAKKLMHTMSLFHGNIIMEKAGLGSVVKTNNGTFYLAVSMGQIDCDNESIYVISMASPIGQILANKVAGDTFNFKGRPYQIVSIF